MSEATPVAVATDHALSMNTIQEAEEPMTALYDAWDIIEWKSTDSPGRMHLGVKTLEGSVEDERERGLLNLGSGCVVGILGLRLEIRNRKRRRCTAKPKGQWLSPHLIGQKEIWYDEARDIIEQEQERTLTPLKEYSGKEWGIAPALLDLEVDKIGNIARRVVEMGRYSTTPGRPFLWSDAVRAKGAFFLDSGKPRQTVALDRLRQRHCPKAFLPCEWLHRQNMTSMAANGSFEAHSPAIFAHGLPEPSAKAQASTDFADPDRPRSTDVVPCQPTLPTGAGRLVSRVPERQSGVGVPLGNGVHNRKRVALGIGGLTFGTFEGRVRRGHYCGFRIDLTQQLQPSIDYLTGGRCRIGAAFTAVVAKLRVQLP
ncbi:hypothetical protein K438DRAFT_1789462 [Mycena galopus ATCC 62051]|nr:hypothetical protein K438DRAFT_1789462 [Mycena galopus ATCC 62051]